VLHSPTKLKSNNPHLPFGNVTEVPEVKLWGLNAITEAPYPLLKKLISFCFLTFCLLWPAAKNGDGKDNKWELKICEEWLSCWEPQTAGGVAQVGRIWKGGDRHTERNRERLWHTETHREIEIEARKQRETEGQGWRAGT
jgi:hypothetical protein